MTLWGVLGLVSLLTPACGKILGLDTGDDSGSTASAGAQSGASTGGQAGEAGAAEGATRSKGDSGGADVGGEGAGAIDGDGGVGGEPSELPILGTSCHAPADTPFCTPASHFVVLSCVNGVWDISETCPAGMRCDPTPGPSLGDCVALEPSCANEYGSSCDGNILWDCDTFPGAKRVRDCPFGCENAACLAGGSDQLIVHTLQPTYNQSVVPTLPRTIPVCLQGSSTEDPRWSWVRDEVERTWGRYLGINFTGFDACETMPARGVVVRFEDNCRGRLLSDIEQEYLDPTQLVPLGICRSYFDSQGTFVPSASEELTRFLTRHQFAHVVHFRGDAGAASPSVMRSGIRLSEVSSLQLSHRDFFDLHGQIPEFARKPPRALVSAHGKCLTSTDGKLTSRLCDLRPAAPNELPSDQSWAFSGGNLQLGDDPGSCVGDGIDTGSELSIGTCDASTSSWALLHAQWSLLGRCAFPQTQPPSAGTALVVGNQCEPPGSAAQSWYFEISAVEPDALVARIQFSGGKSAGLCVTATNHQAGAVLHLEPCADAALDDQTFRLRHDGTIAIDEVCLGAGAEGSVSLSLGSCFLPWLVTGALENAQGLALTLSPSDGAIATASPLSEAPTADQTFDFYF